MRREKTDRAWFSRLYDIQPGDGLGLFLQHRSPHGTGQNLTTNFTTHTTQR